MKNQIFSAPLVILAAVLVVVAANKGSNTIGFLAIIIAALGGMIAGNGKWGNKNKGR